MLIDGAATPNSSRRANWRRSMTNTRGSWKYAVASDNHHTQCKANPLIRDNKSTGMIKTTIRVPDARSEGTVFPIAWNMLELTKMSPDAMKLQEMIRR